MNFRFLVVDDLTQTKQEFLGSFGLTLLFSWFVRFGNLYSKENYPRWGRNGVALRYFLDMSASTTFQYTLTWWNLYTG